MGRLPESHRKILKKSFFAGKIVFRQMVSLPNLPPSQLDSPVTILAIAVGIRVIPCRRQTLSQGPIDRLFVA